MKHLKTIFACLLMTVLSIGQVWATDYELMLTLDVAKNAPSGTTSTGLTTDAQVLDYLQGAAPATTDISAASFVSGNVYKGRGSATNTIPQACLKIGKASGGGAFSFTIASTYEDVTKVELVGYGWKTNTAVSVNSSDTQSPATASSEVTFSYEISATKTISIAVSSSAFCATEIKLYKTKSGGGSDPSLSASPATIDFGTVYKDASVEDKAVTVTFDNLTGSVSYSGLSSPFSASGSISASGDEIIISADASAIGEYEQTLTVQSVDDALSKTVTVTMNVVAVPEPTGTFELFSGDIEEGDYVLVGYQTSSSKYYAMNSTVTSNQYLGITEVSIDANDQIVNPDASLVWTIEQSTNGYYIKQGSAYLDDNATSNKNYAQTVAEPTTTSEWTFAYDNTWTITNYGTETTKKTLSFNISSSRVACYTAIQSGNTCFYLYKKVDGTVLPSAGLAFDATQKLAKVAGTLTAPNLSTADGFDGTVTYASSDEAVVKVNASTGAITEIVAAGKAVITAHSDETENFKEGSASYTIFVATEAGTAEDPLTEASAKALIDLGCTLSAHVAGVVSSQDGSNFTVTLTNGFKFYKAKDIGNVAFESAYLKINDEVTAYGQLTKYSSTYELAEGCYLTNYVEYTEPLTPIANDKDHPYTVAQALEFAAAPATYDITEAIYIAGVVYKVDNFSSTNGTLNIYVKDAGVENQFEFYKCKGIYDESLTAFTAEDDVQVGDEVIGYGVMKHFTNATTDIWEFDDTKTGDYLVSLNRPAVAVTGVTVESTASVAVGGHVTLHAAVVPENASNKTINWSIESGNAYVTLADGVVTGVAEGTAVIRATSDADATKYAECTVTVAPLSPWASVYTSNVTLSTEGGTSASAAKVKFYGEEGDGYDAIKAGTGSAQGAVVVNVPAGATALHFHAYGWTSESVGLTVTAPAGVTVSPATEISINSNSGITSNSPFTLAEGSDPKTDAYYAVSLSGNTEATNITISATSGKRFVLFGVNQEGGLVLESISITGTATALEYNEGDHFSPAGLGVTGHYSDASTAPITEGIVWAFDPDPLTEGTTSVSVTATAAGFTSAAFVVDGLTVAGAAPLSPWATTWTSNLDDITGSKVKFYGEETEYAALKAGSSGTAGSATLNIPAQATELHLHAYGWNSEDVTLSITAPAGVTVTPASITLNRNSGFASNSPFTLAEGSTPQTDAYYALSLSGNTDAIELTITATAGKRFLLFGVNQEGGQLPVLESIEIKGDLTTKTGYKAGDALNLDGLTVEATYSIGGVAQTPVDITDKLGDGLTLTYDPLVENQTEVTITATYGDKSDDITITGLDPVASADPKIYVSTLNVDFGSVEVGEAVPANETVTVTLTNVAAATATLDGEGFSISPSTLTASGDITVSVVASTASAANYSATLTISDDATENPADSKVITLSFAVTEPVVNEEYELVSDVNTLAAGDQIIIVAENAGDYYTLDGSISSQYFPSTAVSIAAGIITAPSTSAIILGKDGDNWTMSMGGQLIGATAAKKASLGNGSASNTWTIAIAENVATITNTTTTYGSLQFNYNNGSNSRFLNYTSTQTAVAIYKKVAAPAPEYETVRSGLEINRYYTVCLPKKVTAIKGASFWTLNNKSQDGATAYLEEETNNLPFAAGTPFIIQATAANLEVVYEGAATEDAGTNGALHGTLVYMDAAALAAAGPGVYMLFSNELRPVGENNHLDANRAYVLLSELNPVAEAPQSAPGKRVRAMPMQPQTATGIEDLNASEKPMKMMINGQIFILRGEKMYDTTGRLVK